MATSSSRRKPHHKPRDLQMMVRLAAASLSAGHGAGLSAKRAAECVDSIGKLADPDDTDTVYELAVAAMRAPGADSGYAIAIRAVGTLGYLIDGYGGDGVARERLLPSGVYYSPWAEGLPYQARVWDTERKKLVSIGRYATPEEAEQKVKRYKDDRRPMPASQVLLDNKP